MNTNAYPEDPCLDAARKEAGRLTFYSPVHKSVRTAKNLERLEALMDEAREAGQEQWDAAMAGLIFRSIESNFHRQWLVQALDDGRAGSAPDAWSESWMRSQFLERTIDEAPEAFAKILDQWPETVFWDIHRHDGRCSLLLRAGYKGRLDLGRTLLDRFPEILDRTIATTENAIGRLLFNGFLKQDDGSWLRMLNEADPTVLYRTTEHNKTSIIEMLAERHCYKVLDQVLEDAHDHDPMRRHGLSLVHFAAKGIKSAKMDKESGRMRPLEVAEMMDLAEGFAHTVAVLSKHGHDIAAKAEKKHESTGTRPRGYPAAGNNALAYFLKRNKAGSLPTEVMASVHSTIMGLTVAPVAPAVAPSRAARF